MIRLNKQQQGRKSTNQYYGKYYTCRYLSIEGFNKLPGILRLIHALRLNVTHSKCNVNLIFLINFFQLWQMENTVLFILKVTIITFHRQLSACIMFERLHLKFQIDFFHLVEPIHQATLNSLITLLKKKQEISVHFFN